MCWIKSFCCIPECLLRLHWLINQHALYPEQTSHRQTQLAFAVCCYLFLTLFAFHTMTQQTHSEAEKNPKPKCCKEGRVSGEEKKNAPGWRERREWGYNFHANSPCGTNLVHFPALCSLCNHTGNSFFFSVTPWAIQYVDKKHKIIYLNESPNPFKYGILFWPLKYILVKIMKKHRYIYE